MENVIGIGTVTGTGTSRSTLPTLRAFRPRATSASEGSVGGSGRVDLGRSAPAPIFDPTQDVTPVRII